MNRDPILDLLREWRMPASDRLKLLERRVSEQVRARCHSGGRAFRFLRGAAVATIAAASALALLKLLFSLSTAVLEPAPGPNEGHAAFHTARHTPPKR